MLRLVILLWLAGCALFIAWRWWKQSQLGSTGGLSIIELHRMMKIAQKSKRMEAALIVRTRLMEEAQKSKMDELIDRVDPVIRKLARQVELRDDIGVILSELDEAQLEKEIQGAEQATTKREQLETQLEHVKSLRVRRTELEEAGDGIIRALQNLHLALVNASATEAKTIDTGGVQSSLAHLEEAANELKSRAQAEDEIATLVRRSRAADKVTSG